MDPNQLLLKKALDIREPIGDIDPVSLEIIALYIDSDRRREAITAEIGALTARQVEDLIRALQTHNIALSDETAAILDTNDQEAPEEVYDWQADNCFEPPRTV